MVSVGLECANAEALRTIGSCWVSVGRDLIPEFATKKLTKLRVFCLRFLDIDGVHVLLSFVNQHTAPTCFAFL